MQRSMSLARIGLTIVLAIPCAASLPAVAGAAQHAGQQRIVRGKTSQGFPIRFVLQRLDDGWALKEFDVELHLKCPDGQGIFLFTGDSRYRGMPLGPGNSVSVDEADAYEALHLEGRIGAKQGSGTVEAKLPGLTDDEKPQVCTSKPRRWTEPRHVTDGGGSVRPEGTPPTTTRFHDGELVEMRSSAGRAAHRYEGSTSQDLPMSLTMRNFGGPWRLKDAEFEYRMRCDDGSGFKLYSDWGWGGNRTPALDGSGRFAVDEVDLGDGFHLHGRLGGHQGSGTVAEAMPELTKDEQAMVCTSGKRDWLARRRVPASQPVPTRLPAGTVHVSVGAGGSVRTSHSA